MMIVRTLLAFAAIMTLSGLAQSETYYFHNDHLGTPQVLTDSTQQTVWEARYAPFGKVAENINSVVQNIRFPGQYFDQETGLHYNYFRDYDATIGRYVESDPIGIVGGINTFGYAGANPLRFIDPFGLDDEIFDPRNPPRAPDPHSNPDIKPEIRQPESPSNKQPRTKSERCTAFLSKCLERASKNPICKANKKIMLAYKGGCFAGYLSCQASSLFDGDG